MEFITIDVMDGHRPIQIVCQDVMSAMRVKRFVDEAQELFFKETEREEIENAD